MTIDFDSIERSSIQPGISILVGFSMGSPAVAGEVVGHESCHGGLPAHVVVVRAHQTSIIASYRALVAAEREESCGITNEPGRSFAPACIHRTRDLYAAMDDMSAYAGGKGRA